MVLVLLRGCLTFGMFVSPTAWVFVTEVPRYSETYLSASFHPPKNIGWSGEAAQGPRLQTSAPPGLSDLAQTAITVGDVARAAAFYRDVLGLRFLFSAGPSLAFFAAGSVRLMLTTPPGAGEVGKNSLLYFRAAVLAASHAGMVARGAVAAAGEAPEVGLCPMARAAPVV